jgi:glycine/D-amino acid oxidase-like deaminating enzyme
VDLKSGYPYWAVKNGLMYAFPQLGANLSYDVVVGAGSTGALISHHPQYGSRVLFALAYGGNGIMCSMPGAGLLRAQIERRPHPLTALFSFTRQGCR